MDKIKEAFVQWMKTERRIWTSLCETNFDLRDDDRFEDDEVFMFSISYMGGQKSRDEEIEIKNKSITLLTEVGEEQEATIQNQDEEIKKLREVLVLIPKWTSNKKIIKMAIEASKEIA